MTRTQGAVDGRRSRRPRLPTMQDIAEHLGVSRQLVSLVLRDVPGPSAESRQRILAAAQELGYLPNASARLLRQNRTYLLGVVFDLRNPFQARVVERLFVRASEHGYKLALGPLTANRLTDVAVAELMEQRVEGLLAFNPDPASPKLRVASGALPVVWLGEWVDNPAVDNIHVNEADGLGLAIAHLTALGHQDILYVGGRGGIVGQDRAEAYRASMIRHGLNDRVDIALSGFQEDDGAEAARAILSRKTLPTAIVCCGDQCAAGVLAVLARAGVAVPQDVSVVGFDDSYVAALSYHQLTSVHQDVEATVEAALSAVIPRIEGESLPRQVIATKTSLTIRESTGSARQSND